MSLSVLGELQWDTFEEDFTRLTQQIESDGDARAQWLEDCNVIDQQLRGKDKRKNKPWPHAADLSIPLTKKLLRRWLPILYNLIAAADPVCKFESTIPDAVLKAPTVELFFNWLLKRYMVGSMTELRYHLYNVGSKGVGYLAVSWDYRTEDETRVVVVDNIWPQGIPTDANVIVQTLVDQYEIRQVLPQIQQHLFQVAQLILQGAKFVKISFSRVVSDKPKLVAIHPYDVIVPPNSGVAHEAEYVCLVHDFSPSQLRQMARDGVLNAAAVEEAIESAGETDKEKVRPAVARTNVDSIRKSEQQDAGITSAQEAFRPIRVHQVYCLLDKNGDGIDERCVLWYCPGKEAKKLALHDFPFSFRYWPVFRFDFEDIDRRPYLSQGLGHHLRDIQEQYNKQYRATSDAIDIQLAPVFQRRVRSKFQPRTFKWGPGRVIDVEEIGDIGPVEKSPLNLYQYLQDRGELKAFAEEMMGSLTADLIATGRKNERRTAFEVSAVGGAAEAIQAMDAAIFQSTMALVLQCVWEMWLDFGEERVFYYVTGEQEPKPFRKSEYSYRYQLIPIGTPATTNLSAQLQKVMVITEYIMKLAPEMANRQLLVQWMTRLVDPRMAPAIILPVQQQQLQQLMLRLAQQTAQGELPESMQAIMANQGGAGGGPTPETV